MVPYLGLKNFQGAIDDADQAIRRDPSMAPFWHNRALVKHGLGDFNGAIADIDQALRLDSSLEQFVRKLRQQAEHGAAYQEGNHWRDLVASNSGVHTVLLRSDDRAVN